MPVKVIIFLQREQTPLNEDDVLSIVPSIAGGTALRCICSSPGLPSRGLGMVNPGRTSHLRPQSIPNSVLS